MVLPAHMVDERVGGHDLTGEDRCWPCTVANSLVGLLVGWLPFLALFLRGPLDLVPLVAATLWGVFVTGYSAYRLVARGYLPLAEPVAKLTGLHRRIGPGRSEETRRRDR